MRHRKERQCEGNASEHLHPFLSLTRFHSLTRFLSVYKAFCFCMYVYEELLSIFKPLFPSYFLNAC